VERRKKEEHSAVSLQHSAKTAYRKGRKDRKEWKGIARQFRKFDDPRVNHTTQRSLATFAPFAVQFLWLNADC